MLQQVFLGACGQTHALKGYACADLVEQMVTCDEVAKNILKFQDVLARRLPVALHLSIHKKETMKLHFPSPRILSPLFLFLSLSFPI